MKNILSASGILVLTVLLTSAVSIGEMPQDPPRGKKHIQLVKIDGQGNKTELDTVVFPGQVFVWNGDTIGKEKEMDWIAKDGTFKFNSDMDFDFDEDSVQQFMVHMINSGDNTDVMKWNGKKGRNMFFPPADRMIINHKKGNIIDLSDPGIVSYDKKDLKDGMEKITIVRKKPSEEALQRNEEIIVHGAPAVPMMFEGGLPHIAKTIKVFSDNDGKVEIIEDDKLMHKDVINEDFKVVEKDGKKIVIYKIKDGDTTNTEEE
ncbi:MAG: hypothetical protein ACK5M7_10715 [Draconibacterium sp.]